MNATESKPDETYNGWTNRETWAFMLWLQNDEGLEYSAREFVRLARERDAEVTYQAAQDFGESIIDDLYESLASETRYNVDSQPVAEGALRDIGSTWRINWQEIADHLNEWEN